MDTKDLFLLQKYDNGDFYVYAWAVGISKKGYTPITRKQAEPLIDLMKQGKGNKKFLTAKSLALFDGAKATDNSSGVKWEEEEARRQRLLDLDQETVDMIEGDDNPLIEDVVNSKADGTDLELDAVRNITVSQEDIQAKELKHINKIRSKVGVEEYMLSKYQVEVPHDKLDVMKAVASSIVGELAKSNRLYLVDGKLEG
jgi:hypothetical protein